MKNQEYWTLRGKQLEASLHRDAEKVVSDLESMYREAERQIEGDISRWYQRFATNNGIVNMAEARRLLNSNELKEFKWTLKEYREHAKANVDGYWNKELENASSRWHISRLEALKYQLQNTVEVLAGGQSDLMNSLLKDTYLNGYGQTAFTIQSGLGLGWDIAGLSDRTIQTLLNKPWSLDGKNFSERIWENKQALINELHKQLTQNMMRGGNLNDVISSIEMKFNTSRSNAARLVYTEHAYAVSVSSGESYKATGVKQVVFIATLDERTSDICQQMDGSIIDMKDYQPGITVPPLHPWCRSTTSPYYADMAGIGERLAKDAEGNIFTVPREMKYSEWKQTFMKDPKTGEAGSKNGLTPVVPGAHTNWADCKTVAEVEKWMKDNMSFMDGKVILSGCDLDSAKAIAEAYEEVFDKYPFLQGKINGVQTAKLGSNTYAQCYTRYGGGVEVNTTKFNDAVALAKSYASDLKSGYHPAETNWKAIVTHELGHSLDGYLSNLGLAGMKNRWETKDVSALLRPKVMRTCGLKVADAYQEVSIYATKNNREWFAECFAEAMKSSSPRKVATEFMKELTELIKSGVK